MRRSGRVCKSTVVNGALRSVIGGNMVDGSRRIAKGAPWRAEARALTVDAERGIVHDSSVGMNARRTEVWILGGIVVWRRVR